MVRYYYFQLVSAMSEMHEHVAYTIIYSSTTNKDSKLLHLSTLHACFVAIRVCSGEISFSDLQMFTLQTCSEKPEVNIMMPSLVSEAQVIHWQCNKKRLIAFS